MASNENREGSSLHASGPAPESTSATPAAPAAPASLVDATIAEKAHDDSKDVSTHGQPTVAEPQAQSSSPSQAPPPLQLGAQSTPAQPAEPSSSHPQTSAVAAIPPPTEGGSPKNKPLEPTPEQIIENTIEVGEGSAVGGSDTDISHDFPEDEGFSDDSWSSASTSLSSSVRDYVWENNRRYHKFREGRYLVPNDEPEQEREDLKHAMIVALMDGVLHVAPLNHPQKMLDIGTGTGIWAIDMGDLYPEAEVIGIDLSPIQPSWVPPNVRFLVDDVEAEWTYRPASLDYIHARHVCMAIKDWPKLIQQSYDALKPGGWIELQEIKFTVMCDDGTLPADYGYARYTDAVHAGFARFGVFTNKVAQNPDLVRDGGFQNVEERVWKLPIGAWPRDQKMKAVGIFCRQMLIDALQGLAMAALTRGLGWTPQQVEVFLVDVRKSLLDVSIHSYLTFHIVTGQKPGGAVTAEG